MAFLKLPDKPVLHLFPRPSIFTQESQAGLDRWIELEATDRNSPPHLAPTMPLDELIEDVLQRYAVQGIAGKRGW